jgi:hypothetical protein
LKPLARVAADPSSLEIFHHNSSLKVDRCHFQILSALGRSVHRYERAVPIWLINLIVGELGKYVYRVSDCRQNIAFALDGEGKPILSPQLKQLKCSRIAFCRMYVLLIISMRPGWG